MTRQTGRERLGWTLPQLCNSCAPGGGRHSSRYALRRGERTTSGWAANYGVMFVGSGGTTLPRCVCMHGKPDGCPGEDVGRLRECSIQMGKAHLVSQWPMLLWSHLWVDHMYFFAYKWRILSKILCFAMEGSHRRLKRMLRNSGGLSLLRGRLGVQVVVNNHTIDDSLRREGWDVTKRSMREQGPVTVRHLARRARKRALSDLNYVQVLSQRWRIRKQRA